ncbi:hypothetical protein CEB3_c10020 [Peptococcaceae bacterium CEB3]|nr:hypothetical protein CEB3_c10020 [Peptococcaceae bacterium CEB3]
MPGRGCDSALPDGPSARLYNAMYMEELAICKVLLDEDGSVSDLKRVAEHYPPKLKTSMISFFSFEAGFSLMLARKNAGKDDVYYVVAHIVRSVSAQPGVVCC